MTAQDIITQFELQVSDITELSEVEELMLLNRVYFKVCTDRPWEFSKTNATGTVVYDSVLQQYYIAIPSDFAYFIENNNFTDNSISFDGTANPKTIFVSNGVNSYSPFKIINYDDRQQYYNQSGFAYVNWKTGRIIFTGPVPNTYLSNMAFTFDYVSFPTALGINDTPIFPAAYHPILLYGMASENDIIQLKNKGDSYKAENDAKYNEYLNLMAYWNALQFQN